MDGRTDPPIEMRERIQKTEPTHKNNRTTHSRGHPDTHTVVSHTVNTPTCHYTSVSILLRANTPTCQYSYMSILLQVNTPTGQYSYVPILLRANTPTCQYSYMPIPLRANTPTCQYPYVPIVLRTVLLAKTGTESLIVYCNPMRV